MKKANLCLFAFITFFYVACGKEDPKRLVVAPHEARMEFDDIQAPFLVSSTINQDIIGSWKTSCLPTSEKSSVIADLEFNDKFMILKFLNFQDANCSTEFFRSRFIGSFEASATEITSTLYQTNVMVKDNSLAYDAGTTKSCGYSFWRTNVWYDVSDRYCYEGKGGIAINPTIKGTKTEIAYTLFRSNEDEILTFGSFKFRRK